MFLMVCAKDTNSLERPAKQKRRSSSKLREEDSLGSDDSITIGTVPRVTPPKSAQEEMGNTQSNGDEPPTKGTKRVTGSVYTPKRTAKESETGSSTNPRTKAPAKFPFQISCFAPNHRRQQDRKNQAILLYS